MKYFTEAWASGEVGDDESAAVIPQYNHDLANSFDKESAIWRFATSVGLNDAYLDRVSYDRRNAVLKLSLITGFNHIGYWQTEIVYSGVHALEGESVLRDALRSRPTEIWYDEFVRESDWITHAVLLVPRNGAVTSPGEFKIAFKQFDFSQAPVADRTLATQDDVSDWDDACS